MLFLSPLPHYYYTSPLTAASDAKTTKCSFSLSPTTTNIQKYCQAKRRKEGETGKISLPDLVAVGSSKGAQPNFQTVKWEKEEKEGLVWPFSRSYSYLASPWLGLAS